MKKVIICLALVAFMLSGILPSFAETPEEADPAYGAVMNMYREGLSGNEAVIYSESDDFNFSAWQGFLDWDKDPMACVGYALIDLDADGSRELLIGDASEEQYMEGLIFDVWAVCDGEAVLIRRGWERWRLYLTAPDEEGRYGFYQEGSDGASSSIFDRGRFLNGKGETRHTLEYDGENANPWQLDGAAVSEEEALALLEDWTSDLIRVELIPFAD